MRAYYAYNYRHKAIQKKNYMMKKTNVKLEFLNL